jgi:2-keto-4-pentenoate hydratase
MDAQALSRASDILYDHWMDGTRLDALPEAVRPHSRSEGYAIQALLEQRSPSPLYGWKIAATSAAGQAHIAVDGPLAGRILRERLIEPGSTCPFGNNLMKVAELEFAFRMAKTLGPRPSDYGVEEVLDAVASLHLAIEIPDSRYDVFEQAGAPQLIADNACANYFAVGPATPDSWRDLDLAAHPVTGTINDGPPHRGIGKNVLGDPRIALTWLVNELAYNGIPLRAGQIVSTGTCVVPMAIAPGDHVRGDFGPLGTIEICLGA